MVNNVIFDSCDNATNFIYLVRVGVDAIFSGGCTKIEIFGFDGVKQILGSFADGEVIIVVNIDGIHAIFFIQDANNLVKVDSADIIRRTTELGQSEQIVHFA